MATVCLAAELGPRSGSGPSIRVDLLPGWASALRDQPTVPQMVG